MANMVSFRRTKQQRAPLHTELSGVGGAREPGKGGSTSGERQKADGLGQGTDRVTNSLSLWLMVDKYSF